MLLFGSLSSRCMAQNGQFHYENIIIDSDQTWEKQSIQINNLETLNSDVLKIQNQLLITTGNTLTVKEGVNLEMGANASIKVENGAELILEGVTVTNESEQPWFGIVVVGDDNLSQDSNNQGKVSLLNGTTIENAVKGISLIDYDSNLAYVWGTSGGVLHAEQVQFNNCLTSIEFMPYRTVLPDGSFVRNTSYLKGCRISYDDKFHELFQEGAIIGAYLCGVYGVNIVNCEFINSINDSSSPYYHSRGKAILSNDSDFSLRADYKGVQPFTESVESLFARNLIKGFDYGVDYYGAGSLSSSVIERTDFIDNRIGLMLRNSTAMVISNNSFTVPSMFSNLSNFNDVCTVGAHLYNSSKYIVESNSFIGLNENNFGSDDFDSGLIIESNQSFVDEQVLGNNFNNLSYGMMVYGNNGHVNELGSVGLDLRFNDYGLDGLNYKDIYLHADASIDAVQGVISNNAIEGAGNRFAAKSIANGHIEILNPDFSIDYYYTNNSQNCIPENSPIENVFQTQWSYSNDFQGLLYNGYSGPPKTIPFDDPFDKIIISDIKDDYNVLEDNFKEILNGGIKPEIMEILYDDFSTAQEKFEKLLLGSPYLSDDVLIASIHEVESLGQWLLTEVLCVNAPLSPHVMKEFEVVQPLTPYLASLVYNKDGNSQRHILELDMKSLREELANKESAFIHTVLHDEDLFNGYQKVIELYDVDVKCHELQLLIESYIKTENYADAISLFNEYQSCYDDNFLAFKTIEIELLEAENNWFQMSPTQQETIELIASQESVFGADYAKAIVKLTQGYPTIAYSMPIAEAPEMRSSNYTTDYKKVDRSLMFIAPNPARDDVFISYELPEEYENAVLEIHNLKGQKVAQYNLGSFRNVYKINCSDYTTGIYLINLIVDGAIVESSQLNIIQQ